MSARYRGRHYRRSASSVRRPLVAAGVLAAASLLVAAEPATTARPAVADAPSREGVGNGPQIAVETRTGGGWSSALPRIAERASRGSERVSRRPRGRIIRARVVANVRKTLHDVTRTARRGRRERPSRYDGRQRRGLAAAISFALTQVGDPYVWGASGPRAWDCSGLVVAYAARLGVRLPHQSMSILGSRRVRRVSRAQLRRGDLVWPSGGHIAIYLGHGRIVHAANRREGVRVAALYGFIAGGRLVA